jgi:hypothetical protein
MQVDPYMLQRPPQRCQRGQSLAVMGGRQGQSQKLPNAGRGPWFETCHDLSPGFSALAVVTPARRDILY